MSRVCFTGEVEVITKRGWVRFDALREDDEVLASPENDPFAEPQYKRVEELFVGFARIWHLHIKGEVIRTTDEHPFYVWGKGWVPTKHLQPGDVLRSHDGKMVEVEDVCDAGYEETVYNCRVAEYHTYFVAVGTVQWSVWAHNTCAGLHHFAPVFMGSTVPRGHAMLTFLNKFRHTRIHRALNSFLRTQTKVVAGKVVSMAPSRFNAGAAIRANFTRTERLRALTQFHRQYQNGAYYKDFIREIRQTLRAGLFT